MITGNIDAHCLVQKDVSVNNESSACKTVNTLDSHPDHNSVVVVTQEEKPVTRAFQCFICFFLFSRPSKMDCLSHHSARNEKCFQTCAFVREFSKILDLSLRRRTITFCQMMTSVQAQNHVSIHSFEIQIRFETTPFVCLVPHVIQVLEKSTKMSLIKTHFSTVK